MIRNLPAMRETQVQPLGWEDPLEKGMAAHFSVLAWRIPWTEEPGGLQSMGSQRATDPMTEGLTLSLCFHMLKLASVVFCYLQLIALNF